MIVDKMIKELQELSNKGYGNREIVITEKMFNDEGLYLTTVEDLKVVEVDWNENKEAVLLLR